MSGDLLPEELSIPWRKPWVCDPSRLQSAEEELRRECNDGHVLHGVKATPVAYRCDCDDCLFRLQHPTYRYAVVHLTYNIETSPLWPKTELFASLNLFVAERMTADIEDYNL